MSVIASAAQLRHTGFMTSKSGNPANTTITPGRKWYAIAAGIFLITLIPAVILIVSLIKNVATYEITPVENNSVITIADSQQAVFAQGGFGTPRGSTCQLTGMATGTSTVVASGTATVSYNSWNRIGVVPKSVAPGKYLLQCSVDPNLQLGIADNPNFGAGILKGVLAAIIPLLGLAVAISIVAVVAVKRSRATKRAALNSRLGS